MTIFAMEDWLYILVLFLDHKLRGLIGLLLVSCLVEFAPDVTLRDLSIHSSHLLQRR